MTNKANFLFIAEYEDGEMLDQTGDGGFTVWLSRAEAQDAADSESVANGTPVIKVVRYIREEA